MQKTNLKNLSVQNPLTEYNLQIQKNKILASKKVKTFYNYLVKRVLNNPKSKYYYSQGTAQHAIDFIETFCKHSKGEWSGTPIKLELWEKAFICALFGILRKSDNRRRFKEAALFVARKNGKSFLASAIALYCLVADGEAGAECYSVATKREQAKIIWLEAVRMIKKSPSLLENLRCLVGEIVFDETESKFQPLSSDSNSLDGLNTHFAGLDEIQAWKDTNLYNVIADSISSRREPIILLTTTMGTVRECICDLKYDEYTEVLNQMSVGEPSDETVMPVIYELDNRSEWTEPKNWIKANPNLNVSKSYEYLENKVKRAKISKIALKNTLCKDFNIRETSTEAWLNFEEVLNENTFDIKELKPDYVILGADLSKTTDLTACGILFAKSGHDELFFLPMFWLPEDLLEKHVIEDKVPYDIWYKQGYLRLCPGNKIDTDLIIDWLIELMDETPEMMISNGGYDSWSATDFVKKLEINFGKIFEPVIQGKKTLSLPMQELGAELCKKKINYGNNPIMRWCLSNTRADIDKNGNIQPAKTMNARQRIDGTAALLNAYTVYLWHKEAYMNKIEL